MSDFNIKREEAILWWHKLGRHKQQNYLNIFKQRLKLDDRTPSSLTGREIEQIHTFVENRPTKFKYKVDKEVVTEHKWNDEDMLLFGEFCFNQARNPNDETKSFKELFVLWLSI